jgi:hypothetical protein
VCHTNIFITSSFAPCFFQNYRLADTRVGESLIAIVRECILNVSAGAPFDPTRVDGPKFRDAWRRAKGRERNVTDDNASMVD